MPPLTSPPPVAQAGSDPTSAPPRVIIYYQTHFLPDGARVPITPLVTEKAGASHVIIAAIHINAKFGDITLNDTAWQSAQLHPVWADMTYLQENGIRVLGLLGGAAKGTFTRLDSPAFEAYYAPLRDMVRACKLDGLDLDVEEEMSLAGIVRLIDRLRADFGPGFLITLAPVASALIGQKQLSGFDYFQLEKAMGRQIAWYNAQFYCGWGSAETTEHYDAIMAVGWPAHRVVLGLVTNPANGAGWVFEDLLMATLAVLRDEYPGFAGVMGWEYFNALSSMAGAEGGAGAAAAAQPEARPWLWVKGMSTLLRSEIGPAEQPTEEEKGRSDNPFLQIVQGGEK